MSKYQREPIPGSISAWTSSAKTVEISLENLILEILIIKVKTDNVILCINDNQLTKTGNTALFTIPSEISETMEPGDYKIQLSDITIPSAPIIGISETLFTIKQSYKSCT